MKKTTTSKKNRKCKVSNCENILSVYNHQAYCYVHQQLIGKEAEKGKKEKKK